jgi:anaerobic selenocysteine-containing dehydrogenase
VRKRRHRAATHLYLTLNQPAVSPLGEAVPNVEMFRRLTRAMAHEDDWYCRSEEEMLQEALVVPVFREMYTGSQPGEPVDPLPIYIPPEEDRDGSPYPLHLLSPKSHAFMNSQYGNMGYQRRVEGEQAVLIHPDDAEARGIVDGQAVRVHNGQGAFEAVARIGGVEQVARGVVVCRMGQWRKNSLAGSTANAVARTAFADLGNAPTFSDTRVEVAPVPGGGAA